MKKFILTLSIVGAFLLTGCGHQPMPVNGCKSDCKAHMKQKSCEDKAGCKMQMNQKACSKGCKSHRNSCKSDKHQGCKKHGHYHGKKYIDDSKSGS